MSKFNDYFDSNWTTDYNLSVSRWPSGLSYGYSILHKYHTLYQLPNKNTCLPPTLKAGMLTLESVIIFL